LIHLFTHYTGDGTPNLEDIFAALRATKEIGFKGTVDVVYGAPHPKILNLNIGNIKGFEEGIHLPDLKYIVETVSQYAKEHGCPEVIFLPIDEPGDSSQTFKISVRHSLLFTQNNKRLRCPNDAYA